MPTQPLALYAAREANATTRHLIWTDQHADTIVWAPVVTACGRSIDVGGWWPGERWLAAPNLDRCSPCEAMSGVLLSRSVELTTPGPLRIGPLINQVAPDPDRPPAPPATLRIGAHNYSVSVDTDRVREWGLQEHGSDRYGGFSDRWAMEIVISDRFPDGRPIPADAQRETLLHELIHCCLGAGNWDAEVIGHLPAEAREEYVVAAASAQLFAVLRDHPELVSYLTAR